ncbi:MAG: hypothetical protein ACFFDN_01970 [Candidatus Hodarchaeota archaeon]
MIIHITWNCPNGITEAKTDFECPEYGNRFEQLEDGIDWLLSKFEEIRNVKNNL